MCYECTSRFKLLKSLLFCFPTINKRDLSSGCGAACATAGLGVAAGPSPLVAPERSVGLHRGGQFHWPVGVLAVFSGWHPLINSVQTSGFFKTPDPVLKRKPSDSYRKTGKGGAQLDSEADKLKAS